MKIRKHLFIILLLASVIPTFAATKLGNKTMKESAAPENKNPQDIQDFLDAAARGDVAGVNRGLRNNVNINVRDINGKTALWWAVFGGHIDVVRRLLQVPDINVNSVDRYGNAALPEAAYQGHTNIVELLVAVPGINLNIEGDEGLTALGIAHRDGHYEMERILRAAGAHQFNP